MFFYVALSLSSVLDKENPGPKTSHIRPCKIVFDKEPAGKSFWNWVSQRPYTLNFSQLPGEKSTCPLNFDLSSSKSRQ